MTQHAHPQIAEDDMPGIELDSGEFIPASQIPPPAFERHSLSPIERRVAVTSEGVQFGNCWISHARMLDRLSALSAKAYKKWLNLPE